MATNFPTSQDNFTNPTSSDTLDSPDHAAQHADVNDAVEALQAKVGVDSSAVTTSHDYKIAQLEANAVTDHGALTGLADDDHTQYLLADGTRTATELTVTGDLTVDTNTLKVDSANNRVGVAVNPGYGFHVGPETVFNNGITVGQTGPTTASLRAVYGGNVGVGTVNPSYKLDVSGDVRTTGKYYIDSTQQGVWTSYTPTLYTGNYSGSPTHTLGSAGAITARYCVWGNVVFVQMDVSYGTFTAGNSTLQPRFSVPSGLRVVPTRGIGNGQGDFMGVGNMSGYMTHDYIGAMMAFNDGQHSSNGFLQFTQADSSSAGGNYNAYDAMFSGSTYTNDDLVTAYGRIAMSGWYRTDAL